MVTNVIINKYVDRQTSEICTNHYVKGELLGKGGFAHCYAVKDIESNQRFALKIIPKSKLIKKSTRIKLATEIKIHKMVSNHRNIVTFYKWFEDSQNVYIVLEICKHKSLQGLVKRRGRLTETEVRYFMSQILSAMRHIHKKNVIHRDLKLGNIFVSSNYTLKLGDFGLATRLDSKSQRKMTLCGTPNYIAPEMLTRGAEGHGFEVDVWSLGVIMYTLLVGVPPFETSDVKMTYSRIKKNQYRFPKDLVLSDVSTSLIQKILKSDPKLRPTLQDIRLDPFFTSSLIPKSLPSSTGHRIPIVTEFKEDISSSVYSVLSDSGRRYSTSKSRKSLIMLEKSEKISRSETGKDPDLFSCTEGLTEKPQDTDKDKIFINDGLISQNRLGSNKNSPRLREKSGNKKRQQETIKSARRKSIDARIKNLARAATSMGEKAENVQVGAHGETREDNNPVVKRKRRKSSLYSLFSQDRSVNKRLSLIKKDFLESFVPPTWICAWVDYSTKYGIGYRLSDGTNGVYFNDSTKMILKNDKEKIDYFETEEVPLDFSKSRIIETKQTIEMSNYPPEMKKKVTLLNYFSDYLNRKSHPIIERGDDRSKTVYLSHWYKSSKAKIFVFNIYVFQIYFNDNTEVIITPLRRNATKRSPDLNSELCHYEQNSVVTYTDKLGLRENFMFFDALQSEASGLRQRAKYSREVLKKILGDLGKTVVVEKE